MAYSLLPAVSFCSTLIDGGYMHPIYEEDENNENEFASHVTEDQADDASDGKSRKKPKTRGETHIVLNHKRLVSGIILFLVILIGITGWQLGYFNRALHAYSAATVTLTVVEKDTHKAIANASVKVAERGATTDTEGVAKIEGITSGEVTVEVSKDGYIQKKYTTTVYRGLNPLSDVVLEKAPEKIYSLTVTTKDAIDTQGIKGAKVTIGDKTIASDASGIASFQLQSGATTAHVTVDGYEAQDATIVFNADAYTPLVFNLTPQRYVVYEQEKSGKIDLYASDLKDSAPIQLTNGKGVSSNSNPLPSPDIKYVAFLSDRDGVKVAGSMVNRLYVMDEKGVTVKTTEDNNPSFTQWINNSAIVYTYTSSPDGVTPTHNAVVAYNVVSKKRVVLSETPKAGFGAVIDAIAVSGDGQQVVYHQRTQDATGALNTDATGVYMVKIDGTSRKKISSSDKSFLDLYFSADSKMVYYTYSDSGEYPYYQIELSSGSESLATSKKTVRERSFTHDYNALSGLLGLTKMTSDGKKYVYIDTKNGKADVFVSASDGTGEAQLTTLGKVREISLSPDNKYVTISAEEGASRVLYVVGVAGGTPKKIADMYGVHAYFVFKPLLSQ